MNLKSLNERLLRMEEQVRILMERAEPVPSSNWEKSIGILPDDEFTRLMWAEGRKYREADRRREIRRINKEESKEALRKIKK